jgi:hypothetical protein
MDKYILREGEKLGYGIESVIDTDSYSIDITLPLITNDELALQFSKTISVVSQNSQTGYEVDTARATAVANYLIEINK